MEGLYHNSCLNQPYSSFNSKPKIKKKKNMCIIDERKSCNSKLLKINLIFRNDNSVDDLRDKKEPKIAHCARGGGGSLNSKINDSILPLGDMGISSLYGFRHEGDVWPIEVIKGFSDWLLELFGLVLGSNEAGGWRLKAPGMPGGGGSCNIGGDVEFWLTLLVWAWAAWAAAANPWKRALRLSAKGEVAAPGPNLAEAWAAMWAWRKGSGRGRGRRGSGLPSLAKRSAWAAAAAAACCCCCRNCMNWVRPFSNMLGVGLMVCGRAKCWPPRGGGGGEGGEYSLIAILTLFCLWSDTVRF